MEKPYDLKDLGIRLKDKGLVVAEAAAHEVYGEVCAWLKDSAKLSKTPFDDVIVAIMPMVDNVVLPQIEKISEIGK